MLPYRLRKELFDSTLVKTLMTPDEPIQLLQSCTSLNWLTLHGALCPFNLKGPLRGLGTHEACPYMEWKDSSFLDPHSAWEQGIIKEKIPAAVASWESGNGIDRSRGKEKMKLMRFFFLPFFFAISYCVCSHVILTATTRLLGPSRSQKFVACPESFDPVPLYKVYWVWPVWRHCSVHSHAELLGNVEKANVTVAHALAEESHHSAKPPLSISAMTAKKRKQRVIGASQLLCFNSAWNCTKHK